MNENIQNYAEEFKIIYVHTLPSRGSINLYSLCVRCTATSFQRVWKEKKNNFTVKKLDKHNLGKVIKVSINSNNACWHCVLWIWWKWQFISEVFLIKAHNPNLLMKNTSDKSRLRDILQTTWQILLKTIKVIKKKSCLINCHSLGV